MGLEKLENHERIAVKALLDSGATGLFMDMAFAKEKGFRIEKLKNPFFSKKYRWNGKCGRSHNIPGRV